MRRLNLLFIPLLLVFSVDASGQSGVIRGRVIDKVSNEPIPFANILIQGSSTGTSSNDAGEYTFGDLHPGQYNLDVSSIGFKKTTVFEIQVTNARPAIVDIYLEEESQRLETVEVDAATTFLKTDEAPLSLRSIGTTEIKRTPGGNRDISKVIRSLPGVSSPPSFRNDIIIRGGAPSENTFYLDGIQIPVINHFQTQGSSGGPVGIINVDILNEVNFYSGAFPASRGNTLSSVFDFQLKEPRRDKWTFNGIVGASDLGATFEGPVTKNSSIVVSARRSYLKFLFDIFNLPFLPVYNDLQFKYRINIDDKNKITLLGIGAYDDFFLNYDAPEKAATEKEREEAEYILRVLPVTTQWNYATGLKYEHFRKNGTTAVVLSTNTLQNDIVKYRDNNDSDPANLLQDYSSNETEYRLRMEDFSVRNKVRLTYGASAEYAQYETDEFSKVVTQEGAMIRDYTSTLGLFKWGLFTQLSTDLLDERLTLSLGVRADANDYSDEMNNLLDQLSPRFSASYKLSEQTNLNFNTGRYYQLPAYTVLGFMEGDVLVNKGNGVKYIQSDHLVSGVEFNLKNNSRITLEGFYKWYNHYPFHVDDSVSLGNLGADFGTIGNAPVTSISQGRSYGFEFLFQQKLFEGYYGLLSYTWVRSEFEDKNEAFVPSAWDNRHIISLTGGKRFRKNWEAGFRFLFTAGAPYTPYNLDETLLKQNWDIRYYGVPDYDRLNTQRVKPYHQLDIRVDKKFFFKKWSLDVYADIQNIYNHVSYFQDEIDIQRDAAGNGVTDPARPAYYLPKYIGSSYGNILPTIGIIIEL